MSNLLKSKFLMGVLVVAALVAGVAAYAPSADAASCAITMTLRQGSTGAEVMCLQTLVGASADGKFGPMTHAAVVAWQVSHGLVGDGIVGPMTRAALMGSSPVIGALPAGCQPGWMFNPATGASCNPSNVTPPPSPSGDLEGGAGSLEEADFVSALNNEEVGEGQEDAAVVGLDLMADDGSDLMVKSVRVSFEEQGAGGSSDFDDYAESVSVWFEGEKVGEVDVSDMNEDEDVWSDTISLEDGAIIDADDEGRLEVAVTAQNSIDSSDLGTANNDWEVTIENIRYEDADGVVQTESALDDIGVARPFFFDSFASANDVELTVRKVTDSPDEQTVTIDEDGGEEVLLLSGELEAEGSDVTVKDLTVTITPAGTGDASEIATRYMIKVGGEEVDSIDSDECVVPGDCDGTGTNTPVDYVFDMDDTEVGEGDAVGFEIWAELDEVSATFAEGDSLDSSVNADDIDAEDESGEDLAAAELSGVANGEEQTFFSEGIMVDEFDTSATVTFTADDAGEESIGKFVIEFDVTANETEVYLDKSTDGTGTSGTNGEGVVYTVDTDATPSAVSATLECVSGCGDSSDNTADEFYIAEGDTETYRLTVNVTAEAAVTDDYAVWIDSINWDSSDTAASTQFYTSNLGDDSDADTGSIQLIAL